MEKKRFYKVIRAFKHNGEIREFPFTLPYTFDQAYALAVDSTDFSVWDLVALVPVNRVDCFTYSTFEVDSRSKSSVIDMESYGIASACTLVGIPFISMKIVTDVHMGITLSQYNKYVEDLIDSKVGTITEVVNNFNSVYSKVYKVED